MYACGKWLKINYYVYKDNKFTEFIPYIYSEATKQWVSIRGG